MSHLDLTYSKRRINAKEITSVIDRPYCVNPYFCFSLSQSSLIILKAFSTVFSLSGFTRQQVAGDRRLLEIRNSVSMPFEASLDQIS